MCHTKLNFITKFDHVTLSPISKFLKQVKFKAKKKKFGTSFTKKKKLEHA